MFRRTVGWLRARLSWSAATGQTTAEYALARSKNATWMRKEL